VSGSGKLGRSGVTERCVRLGWERRERRDEDSREVSVRIGEWRWSLEATYIHCRVVGSESLVGRVDVDGDGYEVGVERLREVDSVYY
jgi:hypothetical protein